MRVSVAIPVYNEREVLPELLRRVDAMLDGLPGVGHEIVIADDGSQDGTRQQLLESLPRHPRLRVVLLSRNFGHQAALTAALDHVRGDVIVMMDGDLQDPPEAVPGMLAALADGNDIAFAVRVDRKEPLLLRVAYAAFYRILAAVARVEIPRDAGDFSVMTRRALDVFRSLPERHRFLRGLRAWVGFGQRAVPVAREARFAGRSKYSLRSLVRLALDGLFSFTTWPIRAAMLVGLAAVVLATAFSVYSVAARLLTGQVPAGFTALVVVTVFLAGMNLFFLGIVGEYVGRIYDEIKQRPHYVVDRVVGGAPDGG
ncbi:MAG: glycosyltransferase family 2 protein [Gemmatimonadetes bacterium]|nr:glycosyltransferase family 2 protein [Gemmatimonadota bacterium]